MTIEEVKSRIQKKDFPDDFIIFIYEDCAFVPFQYINQISVDKKLPIRYVDSLKDIGSNKMSLFGEDEPSDCLTVLKTQKFDQDCLVISKLKNVIVVCKQVDDDYIKYAVKIPKLQETQIKQYCYSVCNNVDHKYLDWLMSITKYDIYRLQNEMEKLELFNNKQEQFKKFVENDVYYDLSSNTVFSFTTALMKKNTSELKQIYEQLVNIDIQPFGVVTILLNNVKNIIKIQLGKNPTPETCGLKPNQFYAIQKNYCGIYTNQSLLKIFDLLTCIDKKIKTGELQTNRIIDYILIRMYLL